MTNKLITSLFISAGIGRTGTFIGLDALEKQGRKTGRINIQDYVRTMRKDRMNMIQTAVCHKVLLSIVTLYSTWVIFQYYHTWHIYAFVYWRYFNIAFLLILYFSKITRRNHKLKNDIRAMVFISSFYSLYYFDLFNSSNVMNVCI